MTTTTTRAQEQATGLRRLADLIEAEPQLADWLSHTLQTSGINAFPPDEDERVALAWFVRVMKAAGATITKSTSASLYQVAAHFGSVKVEALASRAQVCERVVVGTQTVTRQVPDPAAPLVEVTETVEQVEWRCEPLLAQSVTP